jgi:superfamily II DNA or RNA helicase
VVDIAMLQSVARREAPHEMFDSYGLVVVDECHHLASPTFDAAVRHASARRWLGLTATPYRSDGLEEMVHFQCGPIRANIARRDTPAAALRPSAVIHELLTDPGDVASDEHIQETFRRLVEDGERNETIVGDVVSALGSGRHCLVLTQRVEHLRLLAERLEERGQHPLVLRGGLGKKARAEVMEELMATARTSTLLLATSSFLGEGFDCPHLDTLYLAFPMRFRGRVEQNLGRVMRASPGKWSVEIHDYVDVLFPRLLAMHTERLGAYQRQGVQLPAGARRRGASGQRTPRTRVARAGAS